MDNKQASLAEREESVRLLLKAGVNLFGPRTAYDSNSVLLGVTADAKSLVPADTFTASCPEGLTGTWAPAL